MVSDTVSIVQSKADVLMSDSRNEMLISTLLEEYPVLRTEIRGRSAAIDRTIGLYITAVFVVAAVLLRPDTEASLSGWFDEIVSDHRVAAMMLVIAIINGILAIRLVEGWLQILSIVDYSNRRIRSKLIELFGCDVLSWDLDDRGSARRGWKRTRLFGQTAFFVLALAVSISVLVLVNPVSVDYEAWTLGVYVAAFAITVVAIYAATWALVLPDERWNAHDGPPLSSTGADALAVGTTDTRSGPDIAQDLE